MHTLLCFVAPFLNIKNLNSLGAAFSLTHEEFTMLLRFHVLENFELSSELKNEILTVPFQYLRQSLFLRIFKPESLRKFIIAHQLIDCREKIKLLKNMNNQSFEMFASKFIDSDSLKSIHIRDPSFIIDFLETYPGRRFTLSNYNFLLVGKSGIRVYETGTNTIVAFSENQALHFFDKNVVCFFKSNFIFSTSIMMQVKGEFPTLSELLT